MRKKIFISLLFLIVCWGITKNIYKEMLIEKEGVYVVGKLSKMGIGVKGAVRFTFEYWYKKNKYVCSFTGQVPRKTLKDSLMFIKLLTTDPRDYLPIVEVEVPWCINSIDTILTELPKINYCYPN